RVAMRPGPADQTSSAIPRSAGQPPVLAIVLQGARALCPADPSTHTYPPPPAPCSHRLDPGATSRSDPLRDPPQTSAPIPTPPRAPASPSHPAATAHTTPTPRENHRRSPIPLPATGAGLFAYRRPPLFHWGSFPATQNDQAIVQPAPC